MMMSSAVKRTHVAYLTVWVLAGVVWLGPAGCGGPRNYLNDNDRLRAANAQLRDQVESLTQRVQQLEQSLIDAQREATAAAGPLPEDVAVPVCTHLEIGRFSGAADTNGDGADDAVRIYLRTLDTQSRFVQTIAEVRVTIAAIPPGEEAVTVGTIAFEPVQFDAAYRSGMTGTHYTLLCPLNQAVPEGMDSVTARLSLHDLRTGRTLRVESPIAWPGGRAAPADG